MRATQVVEGGNVKNAVKLQVLGILVAFAAGLWMAGCKSAPDLTQAQALTMIQAKYDQTPAAPVSITVNDSRHAAGVTAKYWFETKRYPNGYWGGLYGDARRQEGTHVAGGGERDSMAAR